MKRTNILDLQWDTLVILDACRYDVFRDNYKDYPNLREGKLDSVNSVGSSTGEWVKNALNRKYPDVCYLSANPHIGYKMTPDITKQKEMPCDVVEVFMEKWDEGLQTVEPRKMNAAWHQYHKENKRHVLHYMQPHHPYIGRMMVRAVGYTQWKMGMVPGDTVWDYLRKGEITASEAMGAYRHNLKEALYWINDLVPHLQGRVIISADHGELFGEFGMYEHPSGLSYEQLLRVPVLTLNNKQGE